MLSRLPDEFRERFGRAPQRALRAPGRVNLIGEHTDYNEGLVLPCAIDRDTFLVVAARDDRRVRVFSLDLDAQAEFSLEALARRGEWVDYVKAPAFALAERGLHAPGLDIGIASEVPRESGLSSSAALGVALTLAFARVGGHPLDLTEVARLAHRGESHFVGVGCGIMDQFASALGRADHALRIDCRSQQVTPVAFAGRGLCLLVARSGVTRALARGGYRDRVDECRAAFASAQSAGLAPASATALRDLEPEQLPELERVLPETGLRRARHVITENRRVEHFCAALRAGDPLRMGELLRQGMASLRDDLEVSVPELDALCEAADRQAGCYGSRLTGAGFGGCSLHLVAADAAAEVAEAVARDFDKGFGRRPEIFETRLSDGASEIPIE